MTLQSAVIVAERNSAKLSIHPVKNVIHCNAMSYDSYYAAQQDLA